MTATKWKSAEDRKRVKSLLKYLADANADFRLKVVTEILALMERNIGGGAEPVEIGSVKDKSHPLGHVTYWRLYSANGGGTPYHMIHTSPC